MTHMVHIQTHSAPPSPGQMLRQKILQGRDLKQAEVARAIGISAARLNMILKGRCPLSPEVALRIEKVFGISSQFWLTVRAEFELFEERRRISRELKDLPELDTRRVQHRNAWSASRWKAAA